MLGLKLCKRNFMNLNVLEVWDLFLFPDKAFWSSLLSGSIRLSIDDFRRIYVDDIIFAASTLELCDLFAKIMCSKFKMSMMGKISFFLGLQISQSPRGIFINQSKYALESIKKYDFESCNPVDTTMVEKSKLDEDKEGKAVDLSHYCGMIGTLLYLTASKPDLQFAICMCARYQARPTKKHLNAVKKIFSVSKESYIGSLVIQGFLLALNSIADAEHAVVKIHAIAHLSKHIDIRFHFIKEHVENGVIELYFVNTEYQLADIFTKALGRERIEFLINKLGMRSFTPETLKKLADDRMTNSGVNCALRISELYTSRQLNALARKVRSYSRKDCWLGEAKTTSTPTHQPSQAQKVEATLKSAWTEKEQIENLLKERRLNEDLRKFVAGNSCQEDSSPINLSDSQRSSRNLKMEWSDEVLKLKNFKKDATLKLSKSTNQERYEHVGPEVTSSQDGKVSRWRRDCAWLMISRCSRSQCQIQVQGTSSIQKSMITTTYSQEKVKSKS
ncbi:retrovirus-related pol polyprotein from transposon TNT 1-94 [Tanacetum coccineum]